MKTIYLMMFAVLGLASNLNQAHAFVWECEYVRDCRTDSAAVALWTLSTTLTGPFAVIFDGEVDLNRSDIRQLALAQADQVLNGQSEAIVGTNVINVLTKTYGAKDDETMARALQSLDANRAEFNEANIREALK